MPAQPSPAAAAVEGAVVWFQTHRIETLAIAH